MNPPRNDADLQRADSATRPEIPNGAAAAAILAAGVGCASISFIAWLGDAVPAVAHALNWYPPTGPLSGVSTMAIAAWLIFWATCHRRWKGLTMPMGAISAIALICLGAGFLVSCPPIGDALQGK
jgi:hypothetical protein